MFPISVHTKFLWILLCTLGHFAIADEAPLGIASVGFASGNSDVRWGHDIKTVKQLESQVLVQEKPHALTYEAQLGAIAYELEYLFDKQLGALEEKLYYRTITGQNQACRREFARVLTMLIESYGRPAGDANKAINCEERESRRWALGSGEGVELVLDSWKGKPYIGLRFRPALPLAR